MRRLHEWFYYEPLEREICLWCGFYRETVESELCRGHPGHSSVHNNPAMVALLQRLREKHADR